MQEPAVVIGKDCMQGDHRGDDHRSKVASFCGASDPGVLAEPSDPKASKCKDWNDPGNALREGFEPVGDIGSVARHRAHPCV